MGIHYAEGDYVGECLETALSESKSGKPMIVLKMQVQEYLPGGDNPPIPEDRQYERTLYLVVDPDSEERREWVMKKLRHAGWTGTKFETLENDLTGKCFALRCTHQENKQQGSKYFGQMQEQWDLALPERESKPLQSKPALAKTLNALFGKTLKDTAPKPTPAAKPNLNHPDAEAYRPPVNEPSPSYAGKGDDIPPGAPIPDDEVPF